MEVEEWLFNNWDSIVCISFLPYAGGYYPLMPYEEITEARYLEMENSIRPFDESLISKYEMELDFDIDGLECENGICPIR